MELNFHKLKNSGGGEKMKFKKELFITGLAVTLLTGLSLYSKGGYVSRTQAVENSNYDTFQVVLQKSDLGLTTTSNKSFNISKTNLTSTFAYSGTSNLAQTSLGFYSIKTDSAQALNQSIAAGSAINKWHLTQIVFDYTKVSVSTGSMTVSLDTNAGSKTGFTFVAASNSTSATNLNNNKATETVNYAYEDSIQTFKLITTKIFWVEKLTLTYTIDYSVCQ